MNKKKITVAMTLAALLLIATACGTSSNNNETNAAAEGSNGGTATNANQPADKPAEKPDPFGKYSETVAFTSILNNNPEAAKKFPEGESFASNKYKSYIENALNIKSTPLWEANGAAYFNKFNLMIASNDLPDIFTVEKIDKTPAKTILKRLVDNGMLEDLTQVYDQYASPAVKEVQDSVNGEALKNASFDGKLYGLPNVSDMNNVHMIWVRQDWLDKLNLPAPKSVDDLMTIAKAFKNDDPDGNGKADTLGLALKGDVLFDNSPFALNGFVWSMDAYPNMWVKDDSGKLVYGSTQPAMKAALEKLAQMYKDGTIDKEFALRDGNKTSEYLASGRAGLMLGNWWNPFWPLGSAIDNNPKGEWKAYPIMTGDHVNVGNEFFSNTFLVVKKGFAHPELAMKFMNVLKQASQLKIPEIQDLETTGIYKASDSTRGQYGLNNNMISPVFTDTTARTVRKFDDIFAGKAQADILDIAEKPIFDQVKSEKDNPKKDLNNYKTYLAWMEGNGVVAHTKANNVFNEFTGTTKTMDQNWTTLTDLETKTYLEIITGKKPISEFDNFVSTWNKLGGEQITKEVNEQHDNEAK
ncbi:extracellular solute-binding protein [Paenibacillus rhizovicinus]|uniref:Extracellular solute-binding protein n=1 Tax=Paenibacillus rhizovicinus TaxID=2704463 RepID=A0A6C0NUS3_9BACL|nr:extracellular solute-binding protein [Paenibacillus rhizovicinus]QHW29949.1 extracellular solute-binding protein [Paenibacillus rhizovicinus]